jgi:hypothetical protein
MAVRRDGLFPRMALRDLDGAPRPVEETWAAGECLVLIGKRDCKTTRQAIPFVDRIHRRCGPGHGAVVVLQDDVETARTFAADLQLATPIRLDEDPYPLVAELGLEVVPTVFLVGRDGAILKTTEAFHRADLEEYAARLGVSGPLFTPEDKAPAMKPG